MNTKDREDFVQAMRETNVDQDLLRQATFAIDYERTVTDLEARLRGGYKFQEIIQAALGTTMDFYDADSALVISIDMDLMMAKPEFEVHREGFPPVCGTEPMFLNDYPAILEAIRAAVRSGQIFPYTEVLSLLTQDKKAYQRIAQIGIHSLMAAPYQKRNCGFVAVINPGRYKEFPSLLQVLSYVTVAEINEMNLMRASKRCIFDINDLADNQVYVKLIRGFELRTKEGVITSRDITRKQSISFLLVLLWQNGHTTTASALIKRIWGDEEMSPERERQLRNLGYSLNRDIAYLFPTEGFIQISKTGYSINSRYSVTTDLDYFSYGIRDIEGISNPEIRLEKYMKALEKFSGLVLPECDHQAVTYIVEIYDNQRKSVQDVCLALMYELGRYERMHEFIYTISIEKRMGCKSCLLGREVKPCFEPGRSCAESVPEECKSAFGCPDGGAKGHAGLR
ncbi:MAG: hypothetical protein LUF30_08485 [Lachnospiraceae bacterium]|nr:hypothetical protein [Lachnospiraceae bacterium]